MTFYGTFSGLRAVEPAYQEIARVMGASERQIFFKVSLPAASPWIVSALAAARARGVGARAAVVRYFTFVTGSSG